VRKLTKVEYRKIIWGLLKDYRNDPYMNLEKLLELIMAIPIPKETKEKKKPIKPSGSITPLKSYFKFKSKNIGTFPKPKIERNHDPR